MKKKYSKILLLLLLFFFAFFLRIINIGEHGFWLDEGITAYNSEENAAQIWERVTYLDQSPPGYYLLVNFYTEIFGKTEFSLRFLSLLFGLISIFFLYLAVKEFFGWEAAFLAATLLAVHPLHLGFSVEARMYMLLLLLTLMSFYFLIKAIGEYNKRYLWWFLFALSSVFGLYTHNFYFFVVLAEIFVFIILLWGISESKKVLGHIGRGILSGLLVLIAYLPWLPSFLKQLQIERYWMGKIGFLEAKEYLLSFSGNSATVFWLFMILAIWGFGGIFWGSPKKNFKKHLSGFLIFLPMILIGFGLPVLYSIYFEPIAKIRYLIFVLPFILSIVAIGIWHFAIIVSNYLKIHYFVSVMILVLIFTPWKTPQYPQEFGEEFRELTVFASIIKTPIVVHSPSIAHVINFYNDSLLEVQPFPDSDDLTLYNIDKDQEFLYKKIIQRYPNFILVVSHSHENPGGLLFTWSKEICSEFDKLGFNGIEAFHFKNCKQRD